MTIVSNFSFYCLKFVLFVRNSSSFNQFSTSSFLLNSTPNFKLTNMQTNYFQHQIVINRLDALTRLVYHSKLQCLPPQSFGSYKTRMLPLECSRSLLQFANLIFSSPLRDAYYTLQQCSPFRIDYPDQFPSFGEEPDDLTERLSYGLEILFLLYTTSLILKRHGSSHEL